MTSVRETFIFYFLFLFFPLCTVLEVSKEKKVPSMLSYLENKTYCPALPCMAQNILHSGCVSPCVIYSMHSPTCTLAALAEPDAGDVGHILTHGMNGVKAWPFSPSTLLKLELSPNLLL